VFKKRFAAVFVSVFSLVSPVLGAGYRKAATRALSPDGLQQVKAAYQVLGFPIAVFVAVPVLVFLGYGYVLNMWNRDEFWHLVIASVFVSFFALVLFPFVFPYF